LIVEDEPLVANSLKFLLELEGHEVTATADDLQSALAAVENQHPELALVDVRLARGASGLAVAAEMRLRNINCIFVTSNALDPPRPDLALGCLSKPYSDTALFCAIAVAEAANKGLIAEPAQAPDFQIY
jgi:CheY-like chemotaxis protein